MSRWVNIRAICFIDTNTIDIDDNIDIDDYIDIYDKDQNPEND